MEKKLIYPLEPIPAGKYPLWVMALAAILLLTFLYAISMSPQYFSNANTFKKGLRAYNSGDYDLAISLHKEVLNTMPSAKKVKFELAKAYFANANEEDDVEGLLQLKDASMTESQWNELKEVMPESYQFLFEEVKRGKK